MTRRLLVSASPGEVRAALVEGGRPVDYVVERAGGGPFLGETVDGRLARHLPAMGAWLVEIGAERPATMPARRGAGHHEGRRLRVQVTREAQGGKAAQVTDRPDGRPAPATTSPLARALAALAPRADEGIVEDAAAYAAARGLVALPLRRHDGPEDVFEAAGEGIAETLAGLAERAVPLPGGGRLLIDRAAAASLIDVDGGEAARATGDKEAAALALNRTAAAMAATQIRLRQIAGPIVIDFVGMRAKASRAAIAAALAEGLAGDPGAPQLLGWTRLGHFELVRTRSRRPLDEILLAPASPRRLSAETLALAALRFARREAEAAPGGARSLSLPPAVAAALAGPLAPALAELEAALARPVPVHADPALAWEAATWA